MTLGRGAPVPLPGVLQVRAQIQGCRMPRWIPALGCAMDTPPTYRRSDPAVKGGCMKKLILAGLVAVLGYAPAFALAQAQEKMVVGQVQSVDETGTEITL